MRLIDADKLPYVNKVILVDKSDGDVIITIAKEYTSYVNDETPTVKAIPVEWIKDYVGSGVSDDIFQRNKRFVLNMIRDWEKENEIN